MKIPFTLDEYFELQKSKIYLHTIYTGICKFCTLSRYACMFLFSLSNNLYFRSACVCNITT